jgi:hypothetical protein
VSESLPARLLTSLAGVLAVASLVVAPAAVAGKPSSGGTPGGKSDKTAPTVAIAAPSSGVSVGGSISVSGTAGDNVALARVDTSVDGGAYGPATGTSTWSSSVDTTKLTNGSHTLLARAVDTSGNASVSSETVTVYNAPPDTTAPAVMISSPAAGATVARQFTVSGTASDGTSVSKVEVKLDAGSFQPATGIASWSASINALGAADGQHVVTARATDGAGNVGTTTVTVAFATGTAVAAPAQAAGSIGGYVFQEDDRDGVFETGEAPLSALNVYLYDGAGKLITNAFTDGTGWYSFDGRPDGNYSVAIAPISWNSLQSDWVADTTGSIFPHANVALLGSARVDLGTRRIARSTDASAPMSMYVGSNGLTVKSFDDAVTARDVYDRLMTGALIGAEASHVTIRFDYAQAGLTSSLAFQVNGVYTDYRSTSDVTWASWLRGDGELFHEYGHSWSMYYAYMVQQDSTLTAYLKARGLYGDPRIGSSYAWRPGEMIAEDYRQLLGTASAQADQQMNRDIPLAKDVPGLESFLSSTFTQTRVS